jgi:hypothetical protein
MGAVVLVLTAQGYLGGELVYGFGAEVRGRYRRLPTERESRRGAERSARARTA